MLEVRNLSVSYGAHRALENVSIKVAAGEICVILGANGAGKSSLLKTIGGMVRAAPGAQITIDGRDITTAKPHKVVEAGLALVPEGRGIFGDLTVAENLQLGAYGPQARASEAKRRAEVLSLFPRLEERRNQIARTMSGGEQQMVAIGRALMSNPQILMLDEPSLGLSPLLTKDLFKSLKAVRETGVGILLVEQNAKQSLAIADRGYLIENGHITGEGSGEELARDPAVQAAYLGGAAAVSQRKPEADMREEHRRFYVPAAAARQGEALAAAETQQPQPGAHPSQAAIRAEHRHFYVPKGALKSGGLNGHANGHASHLLGSAADARDVIIVPALAHELSLKAADMATRAARIQRRHVEMLRVNHHFAAAAELTASGKAQVSREPAASSTSDLSRRAVEMAERAARIARAHAAAGRWK